MTVIVDYGMGNLRSILKKFEMIKFPAIISSDKEQISKASKLILPGVGHFGQGMQNLKKSDLINCLEEKVLKEKTPILGICLGMQLFSKSSEEGNVLGLGWIDSVVKKFNFENKKEKLRIPHIGWNLLHKKKDSKLLDGIDLKNRFYFTHSYHMVCNDKNDIAAVTDYGYDFVSVVQRDNIFGTQFHPEKSHETGLGIIRNFASI